MSTEQAEGNDVTYQCDSCTCCTWQGCTRDELAECPTDQLGDSICPCTEVD